MRLALVSVLGLVVACGGDDSVSIATNQDNFCDQIADVVCHNMYQCCTESEIENYLNVSDPRTELQCRDDIKLSCERRAPDVRDSLKAGRITFDANKLNACLQAVVAPTDTCSTVMTADPFKACDQPENSPWVGTVQTGGACFFNFDCAGAPDSFCGPDMKCKMKPTAGFPCGTGCASQYYCGPGGTCAPRLATGAPCMSTSQCAQDLFCDTKGTTDTADDTCAAKQAGGASCKQTNSSAANASCESGQCIPGTCSGSTNICYSDMGCPSHCAISGFSCTTAANCGSGSCTGNSSITCTSDTTCATNSAGTCLFPQSCVPSTCVGDVVCTAETFTADYCTSITEIPSP